jgi:hypothetical protein
MKLFVVILVSFFSTAVFGKQPPEPAWIQGKVQEQVFALTEVMMHDVINPPAAARFYAYAMLTGYEIVSSYDNSYPRFQDDFNGYAHEHGQTKISLPFTILYGILETGRNIIPSGYLLEDKQEMLYKEFLKKGTSKSLLDSSVKEAKKVSAAMVMYSKTDGYFKLSTLQRYKPLTGAGNWQPTAPDYMSAVEPNWFTMRTFFLDSCSQFQPAQAAGFDTARHSAFMQLVSEVYNTGNHLTNEQLLEANFWDCNPFAVQFEGHMSVGLKKISPGGHWMGIAGIAARKRNLDINKTVFIFTLVALSLHDAFVSCWDEKFKSQRIRPETAINRYIDEKWKPLLQTPPFPEYTSGHSVISATCAEVLTAFFGDHFSFVDDTETYLGLPTRLFSSFRSAAEEAAISRLYGGIHYRDAIENGVKQGKEIGTFIVARLNTQALKRLSAVH